MQTKYSTGQIRVDYIRNWKLSYDMTSYSGQHYEALAPDTLDLQQCINLAVNTITGPTETNADYQLYANDNFRANPPQMELVPSCLCHAKHIEAMLLIRTAPGSSLNDHIDRVWMSNRLRMISLAVKFSATDSDFFTCVTTTVQGPGTEKRGIGSFAMNQCIGSLYDINKASHM